MTSPPHVGYLPGELSRSGALGGMRTLQMLARLHPPAPVLRDDLLQVLGLSPVGVARPVRQHSRGMKQRLGLVAALEHDPPGHSRRTHRRAQPGSVQTQLADWLCVCAEAGMTCSCRASASRRRRPSATVSR